MSNSLIQKYNIPIPRYTSYPTVPYWQEETFSKSLWIESVKKQFNLSNSSEGLSLYIHLHIC
jgi:oxygen-independent coproporphyrinogen-3 oxidase